MSLLELLAVAIIVLVAFLGGAYPLFQKKTSYSFWEQTMRSFSVGVFLGIGLIHMLSDASIEFYQLHIHYPLSFLITGSVFLLLLWLDHIGQGKQAPSNSIFFVLISTLVLSIHSFFAGLALGFNNNLSLFLVLFIAILAHKWAASFALAYQMTHTPMRFTLKLALFSIFALMTPLGLVSSTYILRYLPSVFSPIFLSIAAGTFLYLGSLHGLNEATLVKRCSDIRQLYAVVVGFFLMAILAFFT